MRDRQGGTLKKFDQGDIDAVNARRDPLGTQAVDAQIEASLLAQGATPEEIAYVRDRQGGTLKKFDQGDTNAVNAMRRVLAAREDEAHRLELVAANELYAESMGEFGSRDGTFDLAAQAVAEQVEAALLAHGLTPDEIAYVRERQGGVLTKFDQGDADAVNANRRYLAATAQEIDWLESQDELADYHQTMADYQARADLWEAEYSMGAAEVSPDLAQAKAVQVSLDSGEQIDLQHSFEAGLVPHGPPEPDPAALRMARPDPMAGGQETVSAETIYALAFPGRSPEEIAAARVLYPSRASFDREAIDRAKLNTRNDPAQSAIVDEFAISRMSLDSGEQIDLQRSFEAGLVPHGPPELDQVARQAEGHETVDAQTIYALAFPGRSPEEIAAARDLYPSRASFDREAIERATLNTRNDPAQSAMVDEFAISSGYQPLELDMSPEAVNERRKRVIVGTAALWTLPATVSWGSFASGLAGAGIGAVAQAVAPADGERWFELTSADPMRAAHGAEEGSITGVSGYKLGRGALAVGKYGPKVLGSLPGRWGTEAAGGAVSDTVWAARDGRITRNEALYEIGGGAVLSPAFDLAVRGA